MAVGLGLMFGLRLPQNFNSPYKAEGPADFWRRWHISLSTVLRDDVYIPLGATGKASFEPMGISSRRCRSVDSGTELRGLSSSSGGYHGGLPAIERAFRDAWTHLPRHLRQIATFVLVVAGWVLFRSPSFGSAADWLSRMFVPHVGGQILISPMLPASLIVAAIVAHALPNTFEIRHRSKGTMVSGFAVLFILVLATSWVKHHRFFIFSSSMPRPELKVVLPVILALTFVADCATRALPVGLFSFRAWEALTANAPADVLFEPAARYDSTQSFGAIPRTSAMFDGCVSKGCRRSLHMLMAFGIPRGWRKLAAQLRALSAIPFRPVPASPTN